MPSVSVGCYRFTNVPYWTKWCENVILRNIARDFFMFTVHLRGLCVSPFMHQRLGLLRELAHCIIPGWGHLVNVSLLPLMRRVWVYVALPPVKWLVGSACWQAWSSNLIGRAFRPNGKGMGRREYWVTLYLSYLYCLETRRRSITLINFKLNDNYLSNLSVTVTITVKESQLN